jgi:hypothetical protein
MPLELSDIAVKILNDLDLKLAAQSVQNLSKNRPMTNQIFARIAE